MRLMRVNSIVLGLVVSLVLAGCGGKKEATNNKPAPPPAENQAANGPPAAQDVNPVPPTGPQITAAKQRLVGEWHGAMEVNAQKVAETLKARANEKNKVSDEMIRQAIETLRTLKMKIDFHADGGMQLAAALSEQGQMTEATGLGKWQLLQVNRDDVMIRSMEKDKEPEDVQIHFENDNEFSMQPPKEYAGIGMMRFRRIR